jgi:hypothetical protein
MPQKKKKKKRWREVGVRPGFIYCIPLLLALSEELALYGFVVFGCAGDLTWGLTPITPTSATAPPPLQSLACINHLDVPTTLLTGLALTAEATVVQGLQRLSSRVM